MVTMGLRQSSVVVTKLSRLESRGRINGYDYLGSVKIIYVCQLESIHARNGPSRTFNNRSELLVLWDEIAGLSNDRFHTDSCTVGRDLVQIQRTQE